ncbi:MAG TPA: malto-oligosyltrehalose trehalohydrolase [Pseudomonadales bacterium]
MAELRVWAPNAKTVEAEIDSVRMAFKQLDGGWWCLDSDALQHGVDYTMWLDGDGPLPDPRSRWQPHGIDAPSRWVDHAHFAWNDVEWRAPPLRDGVIYELHVGTFSESGDFDGAIERLDALVDLGITHVELMPVVEFAGTRGWGYDGVFPFAPHHAYGGPDGLKRLVEACHRRGLAVILDVVYNHLGPVGNCLERYGPYFTDAYKTPWGKAVNLDGAWSHEVRHYFIDNALMWLRDYHIDGLRLDAVHALIDRSAVHFLEQLAGDVKSLGLFMHTQPFVIAESDLNDPRVVRSVTQGGMGLDAQWNEDFHHALHALVTAEDFGYYADYGKIGDLARVLVAGFCYDGRYSKYRNRHHGRSAAGVDGQHFVACLQNHDQVGNRGAGERLCHLVDADRAKLGAAVVLLGPFVPLLFQGEEWSASAPFQYFTDFMDETLQHNVRKGRRDEFAAFGWSEDRVPDPQDEATFRRSKLDWRERNEPANADMLQWYRELIALRREERDFAAGPLDPQGVTCNATAGWLRLRRGRFEVVCNFAGEQQRLPAQQQMLRLASHADARLSNSMLTLPPWSVAVLEPDETGVLP